MEILVRIGIGILKVLYAFFKVFPVKENRIIFLSRQSDSLSLDFRLLRDELLKEDEKVDIRCICNRLDDQKSGMFGFAMDTLKSMYYLSTSAVCVLDAYWPAVSLLHHKSSLTVIQMWHALGKIKQSGYQTLDRESGRSSKMANLLKMHRNYDYIIAGGSAWNPYYCKSFDTTEDKLVNIGLPRIDYLLQATPLTRDALEEQYPNIKGKEILLYAPTFRRNIEPTWEPLVDYLDIERYVLIIKGHPNQAISCEHEGVLLCEEYKSLDILPICDYLITDYSAIAIEGAILSKPTLYYVYDYEEYSCKNGLNLDIFKEMPGCVFEEAKPLMETISRNTYNHDVLEEYRRRFLPEALGHSTENLSKFILRCMNQEKVK